MDLHIIFTPHPPSNTSDASMNMVVIGLDVYAYS